MKICPFCGAENPDTSRFCTQCGSKIEGNSQQSGQKSDDLYGYPPTSWKQDSYPGNAKEQYRSGYDQYGNLQADHDRNNYAQTGYLQADSARSRYDQKDYDRSGNTSGIRSRQSGKEKSDEDKKTILLGVILAVIVGAVGIVAYFVVTGLLSREENSNRETILSQSSTEEEKTAAGTSEEIQPEPTVEAADTPTPVSSGCTADVTSVSSSVLNNYIKAEFAGAQASSVLSQAGYNNNPDMMVDGDTVTSWQEGAPGDGTGEWVQFELSQTYNIKYIVFNLGNWRDQARYDQNNRPESMTIRLGNQEFDVTFPDGMNAYCVEFSDPCAADEIFLEINSAYAGTLSDNDCCISEMTVYTE